MDKRSLLNTAVPIFTFARLQIESNGVCDFVGSHANSQQVAIQHVVSTDATQALIMIFCSFDFTSSHLGHRIFRPPGVPLGTFGQLILCKLLILHENGLRGTTHPVFKVRPVPFKIARLIFHIRRYHSYLTVFDFAL